MRFGSPPSGLHPQPSPKGSGSALPLPQHHRKISISVDPSGRREFPEHWYLQDDLRDARPLTGSPEEIAEGIRAFGAQGVSHLQMYLIPPTLATIEALVPVLEEARR